MFAHNFSLKDYIDQMCFNSPLREILEVGRRLVTKGKSTEPSNIVTVKHDLPCDNGGCTHLVGRDFWWRTSKTLPTAPCTTSPRVAEWDQGQGWQSAGGAV